MKYAVEISETLARTVDIIADNEAEALAIAQKLHEKEEIVLGSEDFFEPEYKVIEKYRD